MASSDPVSDDLGRVWEWFADSSCRDYAPLYDRICRAVARDRELLDLIRAAPPHAHLPLVLLAAVHFLLLGGLDHPLAAVYAATSTADPAPLFRSLCLEHRDELLAVMDTRRTQTNEVGRAAMIGPALTWAAARYGGPLALVDVGTSAGLNLLCDRYLLDYGEHGTTGPADAAVRIECAVPAGAGVPPIAAQLPTIVARVGLDRSPVDVTDEADARWLLACVWPDTGDRLVRARSAIAHARLDPPRLVRGDMLEDLPALLDALPDDALACVTTTWVVEYLTVDERERFAGVLRDASRKRPIVWISGDVVDIVRAFTPGDPPPGAEIEPNVLGAVHCESGNADATFLAWVHPHGSWIDWRAGAGAG